MIGFGIDFVGGMDREQLMAEISFNGQRLCVLDKEGGNEKWKLSSWVICMYCRRV